MKKREIEGLTILDRLRAGAGGFDVAYRGMAVLSIRKNLGHLSKCLNDVLKTKKGSRIVLAVKGEDIYLATVPITSQIKGYEIRQCGSYLFFSTKSSFNRGVKGGIYEALAKEVVFSNGIDWYPLEKIGD